MSDTVHYKGVLKKVDALKGESLEDQCKRLLKAVELPSYCDTYEELFNDTFYQEMTIQNGNIYRVEKEEVDPDEGLFNANVDENGDIAFEVRYYNGGCSFDEAIESAVDKLKHQKN